MMQALDRRKLMGVTAILGSTHRLSAEFSSYGPRFLKTCQELTLRRLQLLSYWLSIGVSLTLILAQYLTIVPRNG